MKFRKSIENHEVVNRNPSCATLILGHLHVRKKVPSNEAFTYNVKIYAT